LHKKIPLCIVTPSTRGAAKERSLKNPEDFTYEELVELVSELREKVKKERIEKQKLERDIRAEFSNEMSALMTEMSETHRMELEEQKDSLNQFMEDRLDLLTKTAEKQMKRKRVRCEESENEASLANTCASTTTTETSSLESDAKRVKIMEYNLETMMTKCAEAEETLRLQNQSMREMQLQLQEKNDEIERLKEELDESSETYRNSTKEFERLEARGGEDMTIDDVTDADVDAQKSSAKYSLRSKNNATFV